MQDEPRRIPNADRSAAMRARLIAAARALFVEKGYAETSTPEIVRAAEVTRGALYHHFDGKDGLFRAVVMAEAEALAAAIEAVPAADPAAALAAGSAAFFEAMAVAGRARLLLVDGPAVLGPAEMARIDAGNGRAALRAGLGAATGISGAELDALADILSAAFDRAALAIAEGAEAAPYVGAVSRLMGAAGGR